MHKYRDTEIKSFEFTTLEGQHVVSGQPDFKSFDFKLISGDAIQAKLPSEETVRQERGFEKQTNFRIDEIVRDYRGLSRQEQNDLEKRIQEEVKKRLEMAFQDAYKEGLEKGKAEGKASAGATYQDELDKNLENLAEVITQINAQSQKLIESNRHDIYEFVKRFTKWIVLKEINEKMYLENLLEKLILELNSRKNIIVKVGQTNFAHMPEIIKSVEAKLGQLSNVRVEIVPELNEPGIILECENGLIDGSLQGVFQNIDKIFEQVLGHE